MWFVYFPGLMGIFVLTIQASVMLSPRLRQRLQSSSVPVIQYQLKRIDALALHPNPYVHTISIALRLLTIGSFVFISSAHQFQLSIPSWPILLMLPFCVSLLIFEFWTDWWISRAT